MQAAPSDSPSSISTTTFWSITYDPPSTLVYSANRNISLLPIMKPVVSAFNAWSCVVISVFAIVILSVIATLFRTGHEEFVGSKNDPKPEDGKAVAGTIFTAVFVYLGFFVFCGLQGLLHIRESRRGAIAL